ncbi:MAG: hypothetical protein QM733_23955 [Ilumatobacteraceae bacterium]
MESICNDLAAEQADLDRIVSVLDDAARDAPTPAPAGWCATRSAPVVLRPAGRDGADRVGLTAPGGSPWEWGASDLDLVAGPALDFCLAVTQRRHVADTALVIEGPAATEWMSFAQAFAGDPGTGRQPGQFASR